MQMSVVVAHDDFIVMGQSVNMLKDGWPDPIARWS